MLSHLLPGAIVAEGDDCPDPQRTMYTLYAPLTDNNGSPFPPDVLRRVSARITAQIGGCTIYPASIGIWIDRTGRSRNDVIAPMVAIALDGSEHLGFFVGFAAQLALELDQDEVFVTYQPVTVVPPPSRPITLPEPPIDDVTTVVATSGGDDR